MTTPVTRPVELQGAGCRIRDLRVEEAEPLLELRLRNREFFPPLEPPLPEDHFTVEAQRRDIARAVREWEEDRSYVFGIFTTCSSAGPGRTT